MTATQPRRKLRRRCQRCGSTLLTNGENEWCSFVGGGNEKACAYGLDEPVPMTMSQDERLVRAICEVPADDDRRRVYADWLADNGKGEQANFIHRMLDDPKFSFTLNVSNIHSGSMYLHQPEWVEGYPYPTLWGGEVYPRSFKDFPGIATMFGDWCSLPVGGRITYRRGMIEALVCPTHEFMQQCEDWFARWPITKANLSDRRPEGPIEIFSISHSRTRRTGEFRCAWNTDSFVHPDGELPISVLPHVIFMQLPGRTCHTVAQATDLLSDALISYGRAQASLPSLFVPENHP